jgi:hypothetical protein
MNAPEALDWCLVFLVGALGAEMVVVIVISILKGLEWCGC